MIKDLKMTKLLILGTLFISALSGCTAVNLLTAGPVERQSMLSERSEKFHRELSFGNPIAAAQFVNPEKRIEFLTRYKGVVRGQTIVSVDVQDVEFGEDSEDATVVANIRYFQNPTYHVQSREDRETWSFSRTEGWMYDGIVASEEKGRAALDTHMGR